MCDGPSRAGRPTDKRGRRMKRCNSTNCHAKANRFRLERLPQYRTAEARCVRERWDRFFQKRCPDKWHGKGPTVPFVVEGGSTHQAPLRRDRRARSWAGIQIRKDGAASLAWPFVELHGRVRGKTGAILSPERTSSVGPQRLQRRATQRVSKPYS